VAGLHDLKAQETERPHQLSSIISCFVEADKDAEDFQLFLGELQESCKTLLAAFGERLQGDLHVQGPPAEHCVPADHPGDRGPRLEVQYPGATVTWRFLRHRQLTVCVELMLSWSGGQAIPLTIPSPTWDPQGWERGIRSTTEALRPGYYCYCGGWTAC